MPQLITYTRSYLIITMCHQLFICVHAYDPVIQHDTSHAILMTWQ